MKVVESRDTERPPADPKQKGIGLIDKKAHRGGDEGKIFEQAKSETSHEPKPRMIFFDLSFDDVEPETKPPKPQRTYFDLCFDDIYPE